MSAFRRVTHLHGMTHLSIIFYNLLFCPIHMPQTRTARVNHKYTIQKQWHGGHNKDHPDRASKTRHIPQTVEQEDRVEGGREEN